MHVYTAQELRDPTKRPRAAELARGVRIAARRTPAVIDANTRYWLTSPCCARTTTVTQWAVDRMLAGEVGHFYCGKTWWHTRGRGTGCRARYAVRPVARDPHPMHFDLTWTGQ